MNAEIEGRPITPHTAVNPDCQWLFPGQRAGLPIMPLRLRRQLHALGIPVAQARTASFRQLVLQAPPPVVASALGYCDGTATAHAAAAGGTWNRYPAARRQDVGGGPRNPQ